MGIQERPLLILPAPDLWEPTFPEHGGPRALIGRSMYRSCVRYSEQDEGEFIQITRISREDQKMTRGHNLGLFSFALY